MSVNENAQFPVVGFRQFGPDRVQVSVHFGNVFSDASFGVARARRAPIQIALITRFPSDRIKDGFVLGHRRDSRMMNSRAISLSSQATASAVDNAGARTQARQRLDD